MHGLGRESDWSNIPGEAEMIKDIRIVVWGTTLKLSWRLVSNGGSRKRRVARAVSGWRTALSTSGSR